jgi:hypothetical protein
VAIIEGPPFSDLVDHQFGLAKFQEAEPVFRTFVDAAEAQKLTIELLRPFLVGNSELGHECIRHDDAVLACGRATMNRAASAVDIGCFFSWLVAGSP